MASLVSIQSTGQTGVKRKFQHEEVGHFVECSSTVCLGPISCVKWVLEHGSESHFAKASLFQRCRMESPAHME